MYSNVESGVKILILVIYSVNWGIEVEMNYQQYQIIFRNFSLKQSFFMYSRDEAKMVLSRIPRCL